jgi:hypothetical protein
VVGAYSIQSVESRASSVVVTNAASGICRVHSTCLGLVCSLCPFPSFPLSPAPCCCCQAALGYVSEQTEGFVDFDAVPAEGASAAEVLSFVLGPEARDLRPLIIGWLAGGADLVLRDR